MMSIAKVLMFVLAVSAALLIANFSLQEQKTIQATEIKSNEVEEQNSLTASQLIKQLDQGASQEEIIVEAEVTEDQEAEENKEAGTSENPQQASPECILLSRRAQQKLEDAEEEVEDIESELDRVRSLIELEEDKEEDDREKIEALEIEEEDLEEDLRKAEIALHEKQRDITEIEKQCGLIIYLE